MGASVQAIDMFLCLREYSIPSYPEIFQHSHRSATATPRSDDTGLGYRKHVCVKCVFGPRTKTAWLKGNITLFFYMQEHGKGVD